MAERNPSDTQAAFGVFPQLKRNRSKQDREAAKNVPIDLARGAVAGVLGAPGDIESLVRMLPYIDEKTILPTSEDIEKKLPFRSDTPVSRAATGLGTLGGGFYYGPGSPLKVVGALPRAIKHGAEEFAKASVAGAPHVVKPTSRFPSPQIEALRLAQQRAALPIEKGGLGLPANNTPEQRAAAMGFDSDTYHGTFRDIQRLDPSSGSTESHAGRGIYSTDVPEDAGQNYASIYGPDVSVRVGRGLEERDKDFRKIHGRMRDGALTPRQQEIILQNTIGAENLGVVYPLKVRSNKSIHLDAPEANPVRIGPFEHYDEVADAYVDTPHTAKFNEALDEFRELGGEANPIYETVQDYGGPIPARDVFNAVKKTGDENGLYDPYTGDIVSGGVAAGDFMKHFGVDEIRHTPNFRNQELNIGTEHIISLDPDNVRSRFAAFDPWRRSAAIAAAMGVAAPDLLAEEKKSEKKKADGGKVSISNNPDTMMLEVNNRKMAKGGKAVKFVEDVAPAAIEKLAMMFGNKLPLNMNSAEVENLAKRFPEPVVDRVNMAHKDVLKRTPELQEAAARIEAEDMSADEYARLVQRYKPVTPYESVPAPASREEILSALSKTSREAEGLPRKETYFGKPSSTLKEGDPVGLRLDIPSYNQANTWVVTAHGPRKSPVSGGAGTRIGYEPVAMATDVDFSVSPKAALGIAKGAEKNTIATMEGKWKPTSSDEAFTLAKQYLKNPEWRQVGMDPERHSFFYDRETMAPVVNAEEVIQIGPLVLAKNPKYGNPKDFKYADGGDVHMAGGGLSKLIKGALKAEPEIMKASEALGKIEGRPLVITQSDRTKVGEGYLGGPGFSSLQLTEPEYRAAEAAWGVKTPGVAKMILGGGKKAGANPVYTTMIGSPTQHQSNQMVFDKLYGDFKKAAKKGGLPTELRDKINDRLVRAVDKEGNPVFPADIDILDKNFKDIANTFDRRSIAGHLMGGVQVGGKKGQIIDYDKIIRETTDPALIDVPAGALGNRLFTLHGGIIDRPDLHPAFPTILQGEDLGINFRPVERDILMKDFIEKTMREKGRKPGVFDYTRGHPPSQLITEDILTEMQKLGLKAGGEVKKPAAYIDGNEFVLAAQKYGIKDSMNNLNKIVDLVNKGLSVDDAARQVADSGMNKAAGGAISGDDLIIEERPL